jgi:hypothetical protein
MIRPLVVLDNQACETPDGFALPRRQDEDARFALLVILLFGFPLDPVGALTGFARPRFAYSLDCLT